MMGITLFASKLISYFLRRHIYILMRIYNAIFSLIINPTNEASSNLRSLDGKLANSGTAQWLESLTRERKILGPSHAERPP